MRVGERIKQLRKKQKIEQKELAKLTNIPISTLQDIESNRTDTKVSNIAKIVIALGCSADEIIFDDDDITEDGDLNILFRELKKIKGSTRETIKQVIKSLLIQERMKELEGLNENKPKKE